MIPSAATTGYDQHNFSEILRLKISEAREKFEITKTTVMIVVSDDAAAETCVVAMHNFQLGVCSCCYGEIDGNPEVKAIFDAVTLEYLYKS